MVIDALIDSDILIDLLRYKPEAIEWANSIGSYKPGIASIAWMEVVRGATDRTKRDQTIKFLKQFRVIHYESSDSFWAMHQMAQYHLSHGVGLADVMIGAIAVRLHVPIYTRNVKHYSPLTGVQAIRPY